MQPNSLQIIFFLIINKISLKDLNPMILSIADDDIARRSDGNTFESFEFGLTTAPAAESSQKFPVGRENLNSIVARVGDDNEALFVDRDTARILELTIARTLAAETGY